MESTPAATLDEIELRGGRRTRRPSPARLDAGNSEIRTMSKVTDLHILAHARTFRLGVWLPKPETSGGTIIAGETVSEARMHEAAERLTSQGFLERNERRTGRPDREPRHTLVTYTITDAGRAAAREFVGNP